MRSDSLADSSELIAVVEDRRNISVLRHTFKLHAPRAV
jgi:hypothetical protein